MPPQEKKSSLKDMIGKFISTSDSKFQALDKYISVSEDRFQNLEAGQRHLQASVHNLETQVGQIAKLLSERNQGSLPSDTEIHPKQKQHLKAISLRSGKKFQPRNSAQTDKDTNPEKDADTTQPQKLVVPEYKRKFHFHHESTRIALTHTSANSWTS
ncbi:unnamed protein product [Linum trigynum]|uniref:Uncharacterized protein n=1 Tax=Linum trigynum TaxID=586398 RepID=A0AAV2E7B5_9ROSI